MSDPTYEVYSGTMRFDDDNIVDVNLQPDTENINVRLNGTEVTIGAELPAVTAADNGDVLTVVEGAWAKAEPTAELPAVTATDNGDILTVVEGSWAKAEPASQLPAVTVSDNGNVLTVVEGAWAKAAPAGGSAPFIINVSEIGEQPDNDGFYTCTIDKTNNEIVAAYNSGKSFIVHHLGTTLYPASCNLTYDSEHPSVLLSIKVCGIMDIVTSYIAGAGIYINVYDQADPKYYYAVSAASAPSE